MNRRIFFKVGIGQFEERCCGLEVVPLQMDKRAGQLNQAFVKRTIGTELVFEPEMFEHIVRLVIFLVIELLEVTGVMSVQFFMMFHERGDAFALVAHADTLKFKG